MKENNEMMSEKKQQELSSNDNSGDLTNEISDNVERTHYKTVEGDVQLSQINKTIDELDTKVRFLGEDLNSLELNFKRYFSNYSKDDLDSKKPTCDSQETITLPPQLSQDIDKLDRYLEKLCSIINKTRACYQKASLRTKSSNNLSSSKSTSPPAKLKSLSSHQERPPLKMRLEINETEEDKQNIQISEKGSRQEEEDNNIYNTNQLMKNYDSISELLKQHEKNEDSLLSAVQRLATTLGEDVSDIVIPQKNKQLNRKQVKFSEKDGPSDNDPNTSGITTENVERQDENSSQP